MPEKLSRREFIKRTVTAGCGLGLLGCVKPALANHEINLIDPLDSKEKFILF